MSKVLFSRGEEKQNRIHHISLKIELSEGEEVVYQDGFKILKET